MKKVLKYAAAVVAALVLTGNIIAFLGMSFSEKVYAAEQQKEYVLDNADILSDKEEDKLQKLCEKTSKSCKTDVVMLTITEGLDNSELDEYVWALLKSSYDYDTSNDTVDAVCYVIDMRSRADRIIAAGNAKEKISVEDIYDITGKAEKKLSDGKYYAGFKIFADSVQGIMNPSIGYLLTWCLPQRLLISLAVAVVIVLIMMFQARAKMTVDSSTYTKNHGFSVRERHDRFTHTTTTTRHIDNDSSGSGSSGGGSSSSGGSYNSGGGHF